MKRSESTHGVPEVENADRPFRFFDNREKYLLFVTTTSEKAVVAERVGQELDRLRPRPPAVKLFDAGVGNGVVLSRVLREMHARMPTVPFLVIGKEISLEDTRLTLDELPDRFAEHPQTVFVITNLYYSDAPNLMPRKAGEQQTLQWWDVALEGNTAHDFSRQIGGLDEVLQKGWQTRSSPVTGNPHYVRPSVLVLYRKDHAFGMNDVIPRRGEDIGGYDLVVAAQPYRSRMATQFKVDKVLAPLARSLASGGRMVVVQSTGLDPGMEIIRQVWPEEEPFLTPRHTLITALRKTLNADGARFTFDGFGDDRSLFTYHMHALPEELGSNIGTSTLLAAWNAAVYVAQIEDHRLTEVLHSGDYLEATRKVIRRHGGLWFQDESFVVVRNPSEGPAAV